MDLHQRQQFEFLLQTATERFVARLEERHRGPEAAIARMKADREKVWATEFVEAIFEDFLLNGADGACFVLRALPKRSIEPHRAACEAADTVEDLVVGLAKGLFADLLLAKTFEVLEQHSGYQPV